MAHYTRGDKSRAICEDCNRIVTTTFEIRDVPFFDGSGLAENVLVAVCDDCNSVVAIPAQSALEIRAAWDKTRLESK